MVQAQNEPEMVQIMTIFVQAYAEHKLSLNEVWKKDKFFIIKDLFSLKIMWKAKLVIYRALSRHFNIEPTSLEIVIHNRWKVFDG